MHLLIQTAFREATILGLACLTLGYVYYIFMFLPPQMDGHSTTAFRQAVHEYRNHIQKSRDHGSSFSVYYKDDHVVDIVGGHTDTRFELKWLPETVTQAFTLSTVIVPFAMAKLIQEGVLGIQDPIRKYLPQFPVPDVMISDLLVHQAGFPHFTDSFSLSDWRDNHRTLILNITNQIPSVKPKTSQFHYHSLALLTDAIVRKVDSRRRTLAHYFLEEIGWPLGIDIMIGIPRSQLYRAARTYHSNVLNVLYAVASLDFGFLWTNLITSNFMPGNDQRVKALNAFHDYQLRHNWNPDFMEIPLASINMFTNARGLSKLLTILDIPKDQDDKDLTVVKNPPNLETIQLNTSSKLVSKIFNSETIAWMLQIENSRSYDPVLRRYVAFTRSGLMVEQSPKGTPIFGMLDDIMGQAAFYDPEHHLSWAYMTNHAHGHTLDRDPIIWSLAKSVYECL